MKPGVTVWFQSHSVSGRRREMLADHLRADELARAASIRHPESHERFVMRRGVLRELLSAYEGVAPASLRFEVSDCGKPSLIGGGPRFSVSSSDSASLVAISECGEVGVDIERFDPSAVDLDFAFYSPDELVRLRGLAGDERVAEFFRIWSRKEAVIKAMGCGLRRRLEEIEVLEPPDGFRVEDLDAAPAYAAALAVLKC